MSKRNRNRPAGLTEVGMSEGEESTNEAEETAGAAEAEEGGDISVEETDDEGEEQVEARRVEPVDQVVTPRETHSNVHIGGSSFSFQNGVPQRVPSAIVPHLKRVGVI